MKYKIFFAALFSIVAVTIMAQDADVKALEEKVNPLLEVANANPMDWKAQIAVVDALRKPDEGFYDTKLAAQCFERVLQYMNGRFFEVPDSVFNEAVWTVISVLTADKKYTPDQVTRCLLYLDELLLLGRGGIKFKDINLNMSDAMGSMYSLMQEKKVKALAHTLDMRERVTKANLPGIEYSDMYTAILFDEVFSQYMDMYGDKLLEITKDGKKYIILAIGEWNIEKPLFRWMDNMEDHDVVAYSEDGTITTDMHGFDMKYSFYCKAEGIFPQEETNGVMITVTPERRQELLQAYLNYMKKTKKAKKTKKNK